MKLTLGIVISPELEKRMAKRYLGAGKLNTAFIIEQGFISLLSSKGISTKDIDNNMTVEIIEEDNSEE